MRSVDLVENKLREADYFLARMKEAGFNVWGFYCDFTAFLSSARSVTFTLQAVMARHPDWDSWYGQRRLELLSGPRSRFMVEMRNVTQKVGDVGLNSGMGGPNLPVRHFFPPAMTASLAMGERSLDALAICERHMGVLVELIHEWARDFSSLWGLDVSPGWSGTTEELEAALGFPAGWTRDLQIGPNESEFLLLGSPGERPPELSDLRSAYPLVPDH